MQVSVHGPNLPRPLSDKGTFHVHRAGCADTRKGVYLRSEPPWTAEVDSVQQVVEDIYSDIIDESGGSWEDYAHDVVVYPCLSLPETTGDV